VKYYANARPHFLSLRTRRKPIRLSSFCSGRLETSIVSTFLLFLPLVNTPLLPLMVMVFLLAVSGELDSLGLFCSLSVPFFTFPDSIVHIVRQRRESPRSYRSSLVSHFTCNPGPVELFELEVFERFRPPRGRAHLRDSLFRRVDLCTVVESRFFLDHVRFPC